MYRKILEDLKNWKESVGRKPLILQGARQVGKTWAMLEFGKQCFENYVYINFDENIEIKELFETNKSATRLIERLTLIAGQAIKPQKTLIIFDEIQECSAALNALKYFNENAREYCVITAGSLLGTLLANPQSYPVGQVDMLRLYPLSFEEFLLNTNEKLYKAYEQCTDGKIEQIFATQLIETYQNYLIVGGLPECVSAWINTKDPQRVNSIQRNLIELYENDIAKHNGKVNAGRILMVFRNIVTQLAKENKKFIYGNVQSGARAREFEEAVEWLASSGLVYKVYESSNNQYPLRAYDNLSAFKLYMFDIGLLKHMAGVENESIVLNSNFQFRGAMTENYVLQQLYPILNVAPTYFTFGHYETDFLVQKGEKIVPIEVKSNASVSSISLKAYIEKYNPQIAVRFSLLPFERQEKIVNIPLYFVEKMQKLL